MQSPVGKLPVFLALAGILSSGPAAASDGRWRDSEFLTGDWGGARSRMSDRGIEFEAVYTGESFSNLSGGISRGSEYLDNVDLTFTLSAEKAFGWRGTSFFLYALGNHGGNPTERAGDVQVVSNIAAPDTWKIYELWWQRDLPGGLSLLGGLYDVNSEFDVLDSALLFINSSHGIGPDFSQSGRNGPSIFPTTSVGFRTLYQPSPGFYLQGAILDGVPGDPGDPEGTQIIFGEQDGLLLVAETGWFWRSGAAEAAPTHHRRTRRIGRLKEVEIGRKLALGAWAYTEKQEDLLSGAGNGRRSRSWGVYLLAEGKIHEERNDPGQGLEIFGRVGMTESRVNRFEAYTGAGLVYTGLLPRRPRDQFGFAVAAAHNGSEFRESRRLAGLPVEDAEVNLELTYQAELFPWLVAQADLQYIIHPGAAPGLDDALVAGLRLSVLF